MGRIAVAMSGGVDSSTVALLLREEGHEVVGLTMRLAVATAGGAAEALTAGPGGAEAEARRVADHLGIAHHVVDLRQAFTERVVQPFANAYARGSTPNPCVICNREIKFGLLLEEARRLECDTLATGHYARIEKETDTGLLQLKKGVDPGKDQSYFLFALTQQQLEQVRMPAGTRVKTEMRDLARRFGLPVAEREESQEICFIPEGGRHAYVGLVESLTGSTDPAGEIVDRAGSVLGRHDGIHRFTVGQRRGLNLPSSRPYYVIAIRPETRQVVIGREEDLYSSKLTALDVNWISGRTPFLPRPVTARIRYRHAGSPAGLETGGRPENVRIHFEEPQRAVTPGQAVVFYDGENVLGGGWIAPDPAAEAPAG